MEKQKIPITALSMSENIPGIVYKWLINRRILVENNLNKEHNGKKKSTYPKQINYQSPASKNIVACVRQWKNMTVIRII